MTWYREDPGVARFGEYPSRLSKHGGGVIVSGVIYPQANLKPGKPLFVVYKNQEVPVYVIGCVEVWRGVDPYAGPFLILNGEHFREIAKTVQLHRHSDPRAETAASAICAVDGPDSANIASRTAG